jgi:shikimate kinase
MNVFLIGYRCTGKTRVGKCLAVSLGWPFVDTDALIVSRQNRSIRRIVEEEGWPVFRRIEKQVFKDVCIGDGQVVSTGGGIILNADNVALMRQSGHVVLLKATVTTILQRMVEDDQSAGSRPALTCEKNIEREIRHTLTERMPLYQDAMNISLETDTLSVEEITRDIISEFSLISA